MDIKKTVMAYEAHATLLVLSGALLAIFGQANPLGTIAASIVGTAAVLVASISALERAGVKLL